MNSEGHIITNTSSYPSHGTTLVFQNACISQHNDDCHRRSSCLRHGGASITERTSRSSPCLESQPQQPKPSLPKILGKHVIALQLAWHHMWYACGAWAAAPASDHWCLPAGDEAGWRDAGIPQLLSIEDLGKPRPLEQRARWEHSFEY